MPILTPVTPFNDGPIVNAGRLNQLNALITELQTGTARGILSTTTSTADANSTSLTLVPIPGLGSTITNDSPRTLQAVFQGKLSVSAAGLIVYVLVTINGLVSVQLQQPLSAAGGPGQTIPNVTGVAVAVPAGAVPIAASMRLQYGAGTGTVVAGATLQIVDQGAS